MGMLEYRLGFHGKGAWEICGIIVALRGFQVKETVSGSEGTLRTLRIQNFLDVMVYHGFMVS